MTPHESTGEPARDLKSILRRAAVEFPERVAVQFRESRITYRQLEQGLGELAASRSMDDKRVLVLLPDGIASYVFHVHLFLRRAIMVPVTVQSATSRIATLCEKIRPHFVITSKLLHARHASALSRSRCVIVDDDSLEGVIKAGSRMSTTDELGELPGTPEGAGDIRLVFFTSGSTGEPKGVCLSDSNVLAAARMNVAVLGLEPARRSLVTVPLYDYYGFIQIYSHLLAGSGFVFGETLAFPGQLLQRIPEEKITDLVLVPHTLRELLRLSGSGMGFEALRSLRYITSSSDVLTPEVLAEAFRINPGLKLYNIYGLTEAGRACFRCIEATSRASNSIGRPAPGVEMTIEGPPGEAGEIVIRGPNVMRGYFQGLSAAALYKPCSEMRTGDLGFFDDQGEIVLIGRKDHQLNVNGSKIHPAEIERLALQVAGVSDALARGAQQKEETVIQLDVVAAPEGFDLAALQRHLRQNLAAPFMPRQISVVPALKRTEIGSKIIRQKSPA